MTRDEFRSWRDLPQTKEIMQMLDERAQMATRDFHRGRISDPAIGAKAGNMLWMTTLNWDDLNAHFQWEETETAEDEGEV